MWERRSASHGHGGICVSLWLRCFTGSFEEVVDAGILPFSEFETGAVVAWAELAPEGFHPDVMVPEILAVVTPLPISFPDVFGELRRRVAVPKPALPAWRFGFHPAYEPM